MSLIIPLIPLVIIFLTDEDSLRVIPFQISYFFKIIRASLNVDASGTVGPDATMSSLVSYHV